LQNERGYTIAETADGIYTVKGDILPIQIIDSRKLPSAENLWLKSLRDQLDSVEITQISEEISRQEKDAQIAAYLNVITQANTKSIQEAMEMSQRKQKLTLEQVFENTGLGAKLEAKGEERKAFSIAQNMVKLGLPLETVVSATQLEPEKVRALYRG
jgi:predicted transposase YdaD